MLSDPALFPAAIGELIKNAIIYGQGGAVRVQTQVTGGHVLLTISDTGRGFDADEAEHIGEKFYRGSHIADYLANGSGLGVFVAKRVVEASGGALTWHSEGQHKGAEFAVEMPEATASISEAVAPSHQIA